MEEIISQWFGYGLLMSHEQIQGNISMKNKLNKLKG